MSQHVNLTKPVYSLHEINSNFVSVIGPKAAHLGDLLQAGFQVPDGIVLSIEFLKQFLRENELNDDLTPEKIKNSKYSDGLRQLVNDTLQDLVNSTLAVRSSAIAEDLPDSSFAGLYETYLNNDGLDNVLESVKKCWMSAFDPRVKSYYMDNLNYQTNEMAVIIQQQVNATAAGVMFTINPVTGNPNEIKINATKGLGEQVVSGIVTADEWTISDDTIITNTNNQHSLSSKNLRKLAKIGKEIEQVYTTPQDIEWAFDQQQLFILQARPVTSIPEFFDWTPQEKGGWLRHFRLGEWLGEPVTPLFATWLLDRLDTKIFEDLDAVTGVPSIKPFHQIINGWYYAQGNFVPPNIPKLIWFGLRYMIPAMIFKRRRIGIITTSKAYWSMKLYEEEWENHYKPEYIEKIKKYQDAIEKASITDLIEIVEDIANSAGDNFYSFICVGGSAWKPEAMLAEFYIKHLQKEIGGSHQILLQGLGISSHQTLDHQVTNLDWFFPTIGELPNKIEERLDSMKIEKTIQERRELELKIEEILKSNTKLQKTFNKLLTEARESAKLREEQISFITIGWPVMRKTLLQIGEHLVQENIINTPNDIFFLEYQELIDYANGLGNSVQHKDTVSSRKLLWEKQKTLTPPDTLGDLSPLLVKIFTKYETILGTTTDKKEGNIYGMPASSGKVSGVVRIITDPNEFHLLQKGEILVAPMTGPAWTPLFSIASAVITDTGSIMAHASLIAREYGIPAIVGTGNATKLLQTGDVISVDGNIGEIVLQNKMKN